MVFHPLRNSFSGCFAIVFLLWLVVMATAGLWMWEIGNAFLMRGRLYKEPPPILDIKAESQYDARHYHCIGTSAVPEKLLSSEENWRCFWYSGFKIKGCTWPFLCSRWWRLVWIIHTDSWRQLYNIGLRPLIRFGGFLPVYASNNIPFHIRNILLYTDFNTMWILKIAPNITFNWL